MPLRGLMRSRGILDNATIRTRGGRTLMKAASPAVAPAVAPAQGAGLGRPPLSMQWGLGAQLLGLLGAALLYAVTGPVFLVWSLANTLVEGTSDCKSSETSTALKLNALQGFATASMLPCARLSVIGRTKPAFSYFQALVSKYNQ
jgi:hypothetical protein